MKSIAQTRSIILLLCVYHKWIIEYYDPCYDDVIFQTIVSVWKRSSFERKSIYLYLFTTSGQNSSSTTGVNGVSTYKKNNNFLFNKMKSLEKHYWNIYYIKDYIYFSNVPSESSSTYWIKKLLLFFYDFPWWFYNSFFIWYRPHN